ncbi:PREDICTED: uncharacterized protein LOC109465027 [Branchiostoma belcheri]|uniref:Uncharacterized protein LOC109465027 n=1 Tax=Branchiostoma belcheri TaxID=7741 RepID=A0A6P4Y5P8_BRABE|nr:PREDICTED: uncharacterized protein LOC109465027 [Branchiostoma belcheri]
MLPNRTEVHDDRPEKQHITLGFTLALVTVGLFCLGLTLIYVYRKRQLAGRNNGRNSHFQTGNRGEPTESMEMKNINARGRASSSPVVMLQDNIFDRLHRRTHLKRQCSVPNNPANKNGRRSAHDTPFDAPHYWEIPDSLVDSTQQPAPGKLDAPNYWEIPDALVDSVPNSEIGTTREIALANSTRDPPKDD